MQVTRKALRVNSGSLILLSPCSRGNGGAAGLAWLAAVPAHACGHMCTCEYVSLQGPPPPHLLSPCLTLNQIRSAVLIPPSHMAGPSGLPEVTLLRARGPCCQEVPPPPICRMSVEAPSTCPPLDWPHKPGVAGRWTGKASGLGPTHSSLTPLDQGTATSGRSAIHSNPSKTTQTETWQSQHSRPHRKQPASP